MTRLSSTTFSSAPAFRLALVVGLACGWMQAAALRDDFSAYPQGVLPAGAIWLADSKTNTRDNGQHVFSRVEEDSENFFANGTGNKRLRVESKSGLEGGFHLGSTRHRVGLGADVRLRFTTPPNAQGAGQGLIMRIGSRDGNANTAFAVSFRQRSLHATTANPNNGKGEVLVRGTPTLATLSPGKAHELRLVINNSSAATAYDGDQPLPARSMDVWLDGKKIGNALPPSGGLPADSDIASIDFVLKYPRNDIASVLIDSLSMEPLPVQ